MFWIICVQPRAAFWTSNLCYNAVFQTTWSGNCQPSAFIHKSKFGLGSCEILAQVSGGDRDYKAYLLSYTSLRDVSLGIVWSWEIWFYQNFQLLLDGSQIIWLYLWLKSKGKLCPPPSSLDNHLQWRNGQVKAMLRFLTRVSGDQNWGYPIPDEGACISVSVPQAGVYFGATLVMVMWCLPFSTCTCQSSRRHHNVQLTIFCTSELLYAS